MIESSGGWSCPSCQRRFGRRNQSHTCSPALSLDEYFATGPAWERPIYDAVVAHLGSVGPVVVEAVQVGIFIKRVRTFAELRPGRDRVVLSILLSRRLEHPRIARSLVGTGQRAAYFIHLWHPADVDAVVRDWLTEAYLSSPTS
jgi:hypothetical protein